MRRSFLACGAQQSATFACHANPALAISVSVPHVTVVPHVSVAPIVRPVFVPHVMPITTPHRCDDRRYTNRDDDCRIKKGNRP